MDNERMVKIGEPNYQTELLLIGFSQVNRKYDPPASSHLNYKHSHQHSNALSTIILVIINKIEIYIVPVKSKYNI